MAAKKQRVISIMGISKDFPFQPSDPQSGTARGERDAIRLYLVSTLHPQAQDALRVPVEHLLHDLRLVALSLEVGQPALQGNEGVV